MQIFAIKIDQIWQMTTEGQQRILFYGLTSEIQWQRKTVNCHNWWQKILRAAKKVRRFYRSSIKSERQIVFFSLRISSWDKIFDRLKWKPANEIPVHFCRIFLWAEFLCLHCNIAESPRDTTAKRKTTNKATKSREVWAFPFFAAIFRNQTRALSL